MADDRDQVSLPGPVGKRKLGEIGVGDLEQPDLLHLCDQIDPSTSRKNGLSDATRLRRTGAAQQAQLPYLQQPLNYLVVDVVSVSLPQFHGDAGPSIRRVLSNDGLQDRQQVSVLLLVCHFVLLVIVPSGLWQVHRRQGWLQAVGLPNAF